MRRLQGEKTPTTTAAPPRQSLKAFGGGLSIEEFREVGAGKIKMKYTMPDHEFLEVVVGKMSIDKPVKDTSGMRLKRPDTQPGTPAPPTKQPIRKQLKKQSNVTLFTQKKKEHVVAYVPESPRALDTW